MRKISHLSFEDRVQIEMGIKRGLTKTVIAKSIGKDKSTVGKEISRHSKYVPGRLVKDCQIFKNCKIGLRGTSCPPDCVNFSLFTCVRRDRSPGACNGCKNIKYCRHDKIMYSSKEAHKDYSTTLVKARQGVNATAEEVEEIARIICPLIKQGQSIHAILVNHPEITQCETTIYNWIDSGLFRDDDVINMELRRKVSRKITKKKSVQYKKRKDNSYLEGRKYEDYQQYIKDNPGTVTLFMDTVYNDVTNGPFVQTFKMSSTGLFLALYHEQKTAEEMLGGICFLDDTLGREFFGSEVDVIVTDRGSEFTLADEVETRSDGTKRTRIFYCDPMASGQKGTLEQNHTVLRYFLPKKKNLYKLGLTGQKPLNEILSHMNSYVYKALRDKTPFSYVKFLTPRLFKRLQETGLHELEPDDVRLRPDVMKVIELVEAGANPEETEEEPEEESPSLL